MGETATAPRQVELKEMTAAERSEFLERSFREYAGDVARMRGVTAEEAATLVERDRRQILPDGGATSDHHFWWLVDAGNGRRVGELWAGVRRSAARVEVWVYQVAVRPEFRRRGYGSAAFARLESWARAGGADSLGLNVFGWNTAARGLYDRLGFQPLALQMRKALDGTGEAPTPPA